jgi:hypothetical protein
MRLSPLRTGVAAGFAALIACGTARADILDLTLQRLVTAPAMGGFADPTTDIPAQIAYRQLVSEMGTALAPKILTTADTVGYSGFQFAIDASFTSISNQKCNAMDTKDKCPWQYGVSGRDSSGAAKDIPGYVSTVSILARKGIWLPLPSFEIGAGATKLMQSDIFAVLVYAKFALHEGFHDWPIPSLAVRGVGERVVGASQIDLTMAQVDAEVSKSFGIFGTVTLVPYAGAAWLAIIARGQVLDTTPDVDAFKQGPNSQDLNANAVFPDQANIYRWRFFGGFRLNYSVLVLTADYMATACGDFDGAHCNHKDQKIADNSQTQHTFSVSAGFLF